MNVTYEFEYESDGDVLKEAQEELHSVGQRNAQILFEPMHFH